MKICKRGLNFIQLTDARGGVRICGWMKKCYIGSLLDDKTLEEIYHGELAKEVRSHLIDGTYVDCQVDNCPWLANGTIEEHRIEIDEIPRFPTELYLGYEGKCNYNCTCCTSYMNMREAREKNWDYNYEQIEEKIKNVLPYITKISANGRGELFCSTRILKILHNWKPLNPKEKISVVLETNGSLFNKRNWKKIENLGQYHLRVAVTVMSFQEDVYQYLSGTNLPVSNIINNLQFIKGLRERGIINELEIATVLQEQNFREMPDFTKRCLNEFGVDRVRIRPIIPGGPMNRNIQWFMDVRNPYHPYYHEYKKVMKHSIFKHPKVLLWSGNYDSELGEHPGILSEQRLSDQKRVQDVIHILDKILVDDAFINKLKASMEQRNLKYLSLYGIGRIGKLILRLNQINEMIPIKELYDNFINNESYCGYPIISPKNGHYENCKDTAVLVTTLLQQEMIKTELIKNGFEGEIFFIQDFL